MRLSVTDLSLSRSMRVDRRGMAIMALVAWIASMTLILAGPLGARPVLAAEGLTMEATAQLDGHARLGSWMAIDVHIRNEGPAVNGELRLAGGVQGKTRFGTPVDLPTQSEKSYRLLS